MPRIDDALKQSDASTGESVRKDHLHVSEGFSHAGVENEGHDSSRGNMPSHNHARWGMTVLEKTCAY